MPERRWDIHGNCLAPAQLDRFAARLNKLEGSLFNDLGVAMDIPLAADAHNKSLARQVLTRALIWASDGDTTRLRNIKTVPMGETGRPYEPTKICNINFDRLCVQPFDDSDIRVLLAAVLFVPVVKGERAVPSTWRFGRAICWTPSADHLGALRTDYESIRALADRGLADQLSSSEREGQGLVLTAKTAGRDAEDVVGYACSAGKAHARRRGFYLRPSFTASLLRPPTGRSSNVDALLDILGT